MKKIQKRTAHLCSAILLISLTTPSLAVASSQVNTDMLEIEIVQSTDHHFLDVPPESWYANPVAWAVELGLTSGTSATTFSPNDTCNNAQVLTFLWRASGLPDSSGNNPFDDIAGASYYYKAALWAYESGMVDSGSFQPDKPCTRSMAVSYMWKQAGCPKASIDINFTDVKSDADYAQAVAWALEMGITTGTSPTTFSPESTCTRAQVMTFLYHNTALNSDQT